MDRIRNPAEGLIVWTDSILEEGEGCASELAEQTLVQVKKMVGLL